MRSASTIVAVGGGKGGVGKSVVSANLAVALARLGMRTVLVDGDLGAPNLHTMLGIDRPGPGIAALLDKSASSLEEVSVGTSVPKLRLVPGIGAVAGAANPATWQKQKLARHIPKLDCDVIVLDVGAGVAFNVLDLFELGDLRLVVTTPQLTAVQNGYLFVKAALHRAFRHAATSASELELLAAVSHGKETERFADLLARVAASDPALAARARRELEGFGGAIVANAVDGTGARQVAFGLSRMMRDFLGVTVPVAAQLPLSRAVHDSIARRQPVLLQRGVDAGLVGAFEALAERVVTTDVAALRASRTVAPSLETSEPSVEASRHEAHPSAAVPSVATAPVEDAATDLEHGAPDHDQLLAYVRRDDRIPLELRVSAQPVEGGDAVFGRTKNVSPGGLLVSLAHSFPVGTLLHVELEDPNGASASVDVVVTATVRHTNDALHGLEVVAGDTERWGELIRRAAHASEGPTGGDERAEPDKTRTPKTMEAAALAGS